MEWAATPTENCAAAPSRLAFSTLPPNSVVMILGEPCTRGRIAQRGVSGHLSGDLTAYGAQGRGIGVGSVDDFPARDEIDRHHVGRVSRNTTFGQVARRQRPHITRSALSLRRRRLLIVSPSTSSEGLRVNVIVPRALTKRSPPTASSARSY